MKKMIRVALAIVTLIAGTVLTRAEGTAHAASPNLVVNGSFEQDYTGWTLWESVLQRNPDGSIPDNTTIVQAGTWGIAGHGERVSARGYKYDHFDRTNVAQSMNLSGLAFRSTEGHKLAIQLQDGLIDHRMYQDIVIPAGTTTLSWDMFWKSRNTSTPEQSLSINLRDPNIDAILRTVYTTVGLQDPTPSTWIYPRHGERSGPVNDAPMSNYSYDISAYSGRTVRLDVYLRNSLGYFPCAFDNFQITSVAKQIPSITWSIKPPVITHGAPLGAAQSL